jgi:hypothetical protein
MPLVDWDGMLGTRFLGARIRAEAVSILERGDSVVLDWQGVEAVTHSFADELVGKLVTDLGPEEFRARIRHRHLSDSLKPVLRYVVSARLQKVGEVH